MKTAMLLILGIAEMRWPNSGQLVSDEAMVLRPIHTERVYVRLRPSTRVDGRRRT